jgi:hypothetical protein
MKKLLIILVLITSTILSSQNSVIAQSGDGKIGELVYELNLKMSSMTEFGFSLQDAASGKVSIPLGGARFDANFNGTIIGKDFKGTVDKLVDYFYLRPDGRFELNIHGEITTDGGQKISISGGGIATPRKGSTISDLRENIILFSSHKEFIYLNTLQIWAVGTVDNATGIINIKGYK